MIRFNTSFGMDATLSYEGRSMPLQMSAFGPETMRVVRLGPAGVATVVVTVGPFTVSTAGRQQTAPAKAVTLQISPDGTISGGGSLGGITQSFGGGATGLPGTNEIAPFLPDHKVSPGDSWDKTIERSISAIGSGHARVTSSSTYLRNETIHGVRAALIQSHTSIPLDFTMDLAKLASRFGGDSLGIPLTSGGTIGYSGNVDETGTSWLDLVHRRVERLAAQGTFDVDVAVSGVQGAAGVGSLHMTGTLNFVLDRA